ncbi:MAG: alpha/beta fold hydrolase [Rhodoplanes sp.]|uniref:alpha/beta fold hydrolase n=1 Tax=Rhodoplanes sp. TaxID=1968906 RepID=UPI00182A0A4F|nr:alpha/beta fold hydrolase [Rhodoplanes sp.]NVO15156.1 alpha/beta fold hydrolase [Rhodoplanes sp.]
MLTVIDDRTLSYDLLGPADAPVVCFAHALAADGGMWAEQVPAVLQAGYRALRIDMRGHGGSRPVPGDYTLAGLADDIAAVLAACGIARVHLVGLSVGAMIAQAFALSRGPMVESLVLCEAPPRSLVNAAAIWGPRVAAVRQAGTCAPIADATMERWLSPAFRTRHPRRWNEIRATVAATTPDGYCGCIAALSDFDFTRELVRVTAPALVVCGVDDPATSLAENERLAALLPRGRYHAFADARHLPNVEDPARFNRLLIDWLRAPG